MLTVYVIPCDVPENSNPNIAIHSFGSVALESHILPNRNIDEISKQCNTKWFGYIFSNECLDASAMEALPIFLEYNYFDCLILMQKKIIDGIAKFCQSPRIFKSGTIIQNGLLIPDRPDDLVFERLLDGWVEVD